MPFCHISAEVKHRVLWLLKNDYIPADVCLWIFSLFSPTNIQVGFHMLEVDGLEEWLETCFSDSGRGCLEMEKFTTYLFIYFENLVFCGNTASLINQVRPGNKIPGQV